MSKVSPTFDLICALNALSACPRFIDEIKDLSSEINSKKVKFFYNVVIKFNEFNFIDILNNEIFVDWTKAAHKNILELLIHVINEVCGEIIKERKEKGLSEDLLTVKLPMRMNMGYETKCECGSLIQSPVQSENALHVSFPQRQRCFDSFRNIFINLDDMILQYFEKEANESFKCKHKGCKNKSIWRICKLYKPVPDIFCIHLQRLQGKINDKVLFNNRITLKKEYLKSFREESHDSSDYEKDYEITSFNKNEEKKGALKMNPNKNQSSLSCRSESKKNDINENKNVYKGKNKNNNNDSDKDNETGGSSDVHYYLKSVIVHSRGESSGHYICYKKCNGRWYYTSDTHVKEVNFEKVFSCNPYILFYEKSDFEEICPTIIKMNYNINIIIHALATCSVFVNWLNEVVVNNTSETIKSLLYLINFADGNVTKGDELNYVSDWFKEDDILSILQSIYKRAVETLSNEIYYNSLPNKTNLYKRCSEYTFSNNKAILEISLTNYEDSIQNIFEENFGNDCLNYSSQILKFCLPLPKMMCLNLKKVDGEKVLRKFSLRDKLIIKPLYIATENREGVKDKEYYLKAVISQGRCYRNINGSWICVNYDNFKVYNAEYVWIDDPCIIFYDSSPMKELMNKESSSLVNYINFTKKNVITPPKIITINDYLNSFIQAMSSCIIFTEELIKIYDESLVKLEHFLNLIYYTNGNMQEIEDTFEFVKRQWIKGVSDFDQFMNILLTDIFFFLGENKDILKADPFRCHYVRRVSCSCGHIAWCPEEVYFCLNVSTTKTNSSIQDIVDIFFCNKNIEGKVCNNEHCSEKCGKQTIKLCLPLSKTICIKVLSNHKFTFSDIIIIKKENVVNNNDHNLGLTRDEVYTLKSLITDSGRCCYRKVDDTWYKVTGKSSEKSSENAVFACTPHHLFYESLDLVTCDKPLRGIIHGFSSSSSFVKWLKEVSDNNTMTKGKYLYKRIRIVDDNVLKEDLLIEGVDYKWNICYTPDFYKLLKTVLQDIMDELKINYDNDKSRIPFIILNIQSHNVTPNKSPLIIDIEYNRDNLPTGKITLQQLWNEKFEFYSCKNSSTKRLHLKLKDDISIVVLKEPFPSTLIIHITNGLSISISFTLIMKSVFCLNNSECLENSSFCCKKYLLKTIIGINNECYTLENDKWRMIDDSDKQKVEIEFFNNLSPSILFYEEMQTKVERL